MVLMAAMREVAVRSNIGRAPSGCQRAATVIVDGRIALVDRARQLSEVDGVVLTAFWGWGWTLNMSVGSYIPMP